MRKLSFTLLALFCVLQLVNAQTTYFFSALSNNTWNGTLTDWGAATGGPYTSVWVAGKSATFEGTAGTVTVGSNVSCAGITFAKNNYILSGSSTISITGSTSTVAVGSGNTETINAPMSTTSATALTFSGSSGPTFNSSGNNNFGGAVTFSWTGNGGSMSLGGANTFSGTTLLTGGSGPTYTFGGANTFTGLVTISATGTPTIDFNGSNVFTAGLTTAVATRIDGNVNGAYGTTGNAGTITLGGNTRFTNASTVAAGTSNAVLNNLTLNGTITGLGATAPGSGTTPYTIDYRGVISGSSDVYLGNDVSTTATGGGGLTKFSNASNSYTGKTIVSSSSSGAFQCGVDNCFPTGTQFVYGLAGGTSAHVGIVDLNGHNIQVASIETAGGGTPTFVGLTNSQSSGGNVTIVGSATKTFSALIGAASVGTPNSITGTNNVSLTLGASNTGSLTLGAANTFTGGLTINGGTLITGIAQALAATLPVTINGGTLNTGSGAGFNQGTGTGSSQSLGALTVGSNGGTLAMSTSNTIYFANSSGATWGGGTLSITGWTGSNHIFVGNSNLGLTSIQLGLITFSGGTYNGQHAQILASGEIVPTAVGVTVSILNVTTAGSEGAGTVYTINVSSTGTPSAGSTVTFTLSGVQATQIVAGLTGTITFSGSSTTASGTFTAQNDNIFEGTETGGVQLTNYAGSNISGISNGIVNFTLADAATLWWNGLAHASGNGLTPNGGNGNWTVNNSWVGVATGSATGTGTNWIEGYAAILAGTGGMVSITDATTINPTTTTVKSTGYTITSDGSTSTFINGNIAIDPGINLTLNDAAATGNKTLNVGSISGGTGSTLTIAGAQTSSNNSRVNISQANAVISVPVIINGTGSANGFAGIAATAAGIQVTGNINNTGTEPTMLGSTVLHGLAVTGNITGTSGVVFAAGSNGGAGTVLLSGNNTYSGVTKFINNSSGLIQCGSATALSPNSELNMGSSSTFGSPLDLNGFDETVGALSSGSGTGNITNNASGTGTNTITVNQSTNTTFGLTITDGTSKKTALTKAGTGTLTITGLNTFTGALTLTGGTLQMGGSGNLLANSMPVAFNGGTFSTGTTTGYSETLGSLTLSASSTIALGSGGHTLTFGTGGSFTNGTILTISNWSGTAGISGGAGAGSGKVIIGRTLNTGELDQISFSGFESGAYQNASTGEIYPKGDLLTATLAVVSPATGSEIAGTTYTITINTTISGIVTNVNQPSEVNYTITGIQASQLASGSLSGTITVPANSSTASISFTVHNDGIFQGQETGLVSISMPTPSSLAGDIGFASITTQSFILNDQANMYWNGGTAANNPATGGTGTWSTNNAWIAPVNDGTGSHASWGPGGYDVYLVPTAGTVTLTTSPNPTNVYVQDNNYVLTTSTSPNNNEALGGTIHLPAGYNLNIFSNNITTSKELDINAVSSGAGSTITINQGAATAIKTDVMGLVQANATIATDIKISSTVASAGAGSVVGIVGSADGINISGSITNTSSTFAYTLLGVSGSSNTMTISGPISSTAPINFASGTTGGAGTLVLTNTNNAFTTAYFNGSSNGTLKAGVPGSIPTGALFVMGATSGSGQNFDLNGNDVTVASLSSVSGGTGIITNSAASGTNTLTINQSGNTNFGLAIQDGASAKTAVAKSGSGTFTISAVESFTGGLILNGGVFQMGVNNNILPNTLPVTFNGGTFSTGATAGFNETVGTLSLVTTGTIALGTGSHALTFNGVGAFTGSVLNVTGWAGTGGASGTAGKIIVNGGTLTAGDLAKFRFSGINGAYPRGAVMVGNEVVPPAGYAWTGLGGNTAWTTANNWNPTITGGPTGCAASVYIPVVSNYPVLTSAVSVGDFAIADNAQITLNAALNSCGNITGGTSSAGKVLGTSALTLNGTGAQSISGSISANSIEINKATGAVTSTGNLSVNTGLIMTKGNFTNSAGTVTLVSNSSGDAYLDNFTSGTAGTYSGNLTVQRYISNPSDGYRDLSSPVATTVADLANSFSVFGSNGVDCWYSYSPYPNVQVYNEALNNVGSANGLYNAGWVSYTGNGNALTALKGVAARTYQGVPFTVSFTGSPYTGSQSVSVTNTPSGTIADDGWNFVGNPYPSPIKWSLVKAMNTNITGGSYHVFKTSGEYTGGWASHNGVTGVGGAIDEIAPGQGFFVFAPSGTNTFKMDNTVRTVTPGSFRSLQALDNEVRLVLTNGSNSDEVVTYTDPQATTGYDVEQDALKIPAGSTVNMAYSLQGNNYAINVIDNLNEQTVLPLTILVQDSGTYTLSATTLNVPGLSTYLKDAINNSLVSLDSGSVQLVLNAGQTYTGRYSIVFAPIPTATGVKDLETGVTSIYSFGNKVFVQRPNSNEATIIVTNILGQDIAEFKAQSEKSEFELPATTPWYAIIKVVEGKKVTVSKVLITGK